MKIWFQRLIEPSIIKSLAHCSVSRFFFLISGRSTGDYFYITAAENNTHVDIATKYIFTLDASESREIILSSMEHVKISSDKPILVTQVTYWVPDIVNEKNKNLNQKSLSMAKIV